MRSRSEILKTFGYIILLFPVIIFALEISFLLFNKSNNRFVSGTIYDSLTGWRNNCDKKFQNYLCRLIWMGLERWRPELAIKHDVKTFILDSFLNSKRYKSVTLISHYYDKEF